VPDILSSLILQDDDDHVIFLMDPASHPLISAPILQPVPRLMSFCESRLLIDSKLPDRESGKK
jgi:hypothetical protein